MAVDKEGLFAVTTYLLIFFNYALLLIFIIAFADVFPMAYLFMIAYLILILFCHLSTINLIPQLILRFILILDFQTYFKEKIFTRVIKYNNIIKKGFNKNTITKLRVDYSKAFKMADCNNDKWIKTASVFLLWPWVYLEGNCLNNLGTSLNSLHEKFYIIIYGIKAGMIILYVILFAFYLDNKFKIAMYISFMAVMIALSLYRIEIVQISWYGIMIILPLFFLFIVNLCIVPIYMWWKSWADNRRNAHNERNYQNVQRPPAQNNQPIYNQLNGQNPPQPNQQVAQPAQPLPAQLEPQVHFGLFARVQRVPTIKVMGDMLSQWRRSYSIKENQVQAWCVCLEEFQKGEQIVELHCGKGHIFHPHWIEGWAKRNKSCPLWRTDFVELARKEQADRHNKPEENKEIDDNAALPVRV